MISVQTDKILNIILPNTNKALAQVLKDISPKELDTMAKSKDLKSIINSLLKESSQNSNSNKTMLELVKNNPTLNSLGSANKDIKELLNTLKADKNLQNIEKTLKKFLPDIKDVKNTNVKTTIENSGIFLESKLKDIQNPQVKLNTLLTELSNILKKSELPTANKLNTQVQAMVSQASPKEEPKALQNLAKNIQYVLGKLQTEFKSADPVTTKEFAVKLDKLQYIIEPKNLQSDNFKLSNLQDSLKQVTTILKEAFVKEASDAFSNLTKVLNAIESIKQNPLPSKTILEQIVDKKIPQEIQKNIQLLQTTIKSEDPVFSKEARTIFNELSSIKGADKLSPQQNIKEILSNDLKAVLYKVSEDVSKLNIPNQSEVLKQVDKLSLQIDYYQLVSHLSDSSSLYSPYSWEQMEDGNITIRDAKKDRFYCDIDLTLKDFGELNIRLGLFEKNQLNVHISSDSKELKEMIKENLPSLRKALVDIQITPREIHLFDKSKVQSVAYEDNFKYLDIGFEAKV